MITAMLCLPLSFVFLPSLSEYICSIRLNKRKAAFIGSEAVVDMANTDTVIVDDIDAVEVVEFTEIRPEGSTDFENAFEVARIIFKKLSGPFGKVFNDTEATETEDVHHEITINKVTETGIELLFDGAATVLLGNRHYMNMNGVRVKTDSSLSTATKGSDRSTVFMAIDGVPRLGFILNSNIRPEFWKTVADLDSNGIKVYIESYEPQVNDVFFEQNKKNNSAVVSVYRPAEYEYSSNLYMRDGGVISTESGLSVADIIPISKEIVAQRKSNRKLNVILTASGILLSCLMVVLLNLPVASVFVDVIKSHATFLVNAIVLLLLIPAAIRLKKISKS
jgi:Cu+-exporting ATPase